MTIFLANPTLVAGKPNEIAIDVGRGKAHSSTHYSACIVYQRLFYYVPGPVHQSVVMERLINGVVRTQDRIALSLSITVLYRLLVRFYQRVVRSLSSFSWRCSPHSFIRSPRIKPTPEKPSEEGHKAILLLILVINVGWPDALEVDPVDLWRGRNGCGDVEDNVHVEPQPPCELEPCDCERGCKGEAESAKGSAAIHNMQVLRSVRGGIGCGGTRAASES